MASLPDFIARCAAYTVSEVRPVGTPPLESQCASQIFRHPVDNFRRLVDHYEQEPCYPLRLPNALLPIPQGSRSQPT